LILEDAVAYVALVRLHLSVMLFAAALLLFFGSGLVSVVPTCFNITGLHRRGDTIPSKLFIVATDFSANKVAAKTLHPGQFHSNTL
jgi:hypothetical protein